MANMLRRDMLFAFLPWLSQHRPLTQVAEVFATSPEIIKAKIRRFRQWLLVLDPTGRYEQRVRLGLKVPWPSMACPKCNEHAPARPHGFRRARGGRLVVPRERLFRCTGCHGFFGLPVDEISVHIGEDGRGG
jgi:transposase-like protein